MIPCMEKYGTKSKKVCLQFGTESDIFRCDFRFFLDLVPVVLSVILDLILEVLPVVSDLILMFSIFSDVITMVSFVFHMIHSSSSQLVETFTLCPLDPHTLPIR